MWRAVVSQPLNRNCTIPTLGELDEEAGEFWVENPFMMMGLRANLSSFERNRLFLNDDGTHFIDASFASRVDIDSDSRNVVAADFDRDGAVDLLVGSVGGGPLRLFRNRFPKCNSVRLEVIGTNSNRAGIGTRITAECGDRRIIRDVFPANGFMGQGPAEVSIGLGKQDQITRLHVRWPTGKTEHFDDIPRSNHLIVTEGNGLRAGSGADR